MLRPLWRNGHRYFKVGVLLDDLRDAEAEPRHRFRSGKAGIGATDDIVQQHVAVVIGKAQDDAVAALQRAADELDGCGATRYRDAAERELRKLKRRAS